MIHKKAVLKMEEELPTPTHKWRRQREDRESGEERKGESVGGMACQAGDALSVYNANVYFLLNHYAN